jgi:uncharacterized protein (TIGR03067 family)
MHLPRLLLCASVLGLLVGCGGTKTPSVAKNSPSVAVNTPPKVTPPSPPVEPPPMKTPEPMPPSKTPPPPPPSKEAAAELEKFQGTWTLTQHEIGAPAKEPPVGKLEITGEKYKFTIDGQVTLGTLRLDPTKSPKHIDAVIDTGVLPGIYELDGDVQKSIFAQPGRPRPTEFTAKMGAGHQLFVFKRQKTEEKPPDLK